MQRLARFLGAAAALILMAAAFQPACATTFQTGDSLTLNFDFTGQTPPPPYVSGSLQFDFTNFNTGDSASIQFFGGLNGTGALVFSTTSSGNSGGILFLTISWGLFADLVDGIFSITLSAIHGPFDVNFHPAVEVNAAGAQASVAGTVSRVVPEPASLSLIAIGVLAAAMAGRRRSRVMATTQDRS